MIGEPLGFMFFSMIETFALYFLIMCMFRFKWRRFAWQALTLSFVINTISFFLRDDYHLGNYMPVVTIFFFFAFFKVVMRLPMIFSLIITVAGYVTFGIVQVILAILLLGSIDAVKDSLTNGYVLQFATAAVIIPGVWLLYRMGYGSTFGVAQLRFRFEDVTAVAMIILVLSSITAVLYDNQLYVITVFFAASSYYFVRYAIKKEKQSD
ncbi:hypothetical protein C162_22008 [Paenibacillus sp. FSL R7-269]|uniref:hypothetical protein n=1 Tax=Paenibacillus sp. FSL R7-269 TaxID=1226755 RepID=UPI0003E299F2|nr:hypothetical protein [Paenibacillus sp. FSL R7-269]ETT45256.1 hypothetical protein C162_22008 [Paenibacillus sp. FSL R7-269]